MKIQLKNLPQLTLNGLLKRRKMSLKNFMNEFGISSYEGLNLHCKSLGVQVPSMDDFKLVYPDVSTFVNSPSEGVVVVESSPELETVFSPNLHEVEVFCGEEYMTSIEEVPSDTDFKNRKKKSNKST